MTKITDDTLNDRDLLDIIRERVFNLPLLPQNRVLEFFNALDSTLACSVDALLTNSNYVENYLADVVAEVAASVTHGRTIYSRLSTRRKKGDPEPPAVPAGTPEAVYKRTSDIRFLEQSTKFIRMLSFYQDKDLDLASDQKNHVREILSEIKFVRLVYEEIIQSFTKITEGYLDLARQAARLHNEIHSIKLKSEFTASMSEYANLHDQMEAIETAAQVDRARLYHLCLLIEKNNDRQTSLRNTVYGPYLRIVYKEAKRHATTKTQVLDNFQNGATGLMRGISCYNLDRNVSFSSYAHWWIRQAILYHIKDSSNFVKLPVTTWQTYTGIEKAKARISTRDGTDSLEALSEETGHSISKLKEVAAAVRSSHVHSLDYEVDDSGKMLLIDVMPDTETEERSRLADVAKDVEQRLSRLTDEQRWVMLLHYGMVGKLEHSGEILPLDIMREKTNQKLAAAAV